MNSPILSRALLRSANNMSLRPTIPPSSAFPHTSISHSKSQSSPQTPKVETALCRSCLSMVAETPELDLMIGSIPDIMWKGRTCLFCEFLGVFLNHYFLLFAKENPATRSVELTSVRCYRPGSPAFIRFRVSCLLDTQRKLTATHRESEESFVCWVYLRQAATHPSRQYLRQLEDPDRHLSATRGMSILDPNLIRPFLRNCNGILGSCSRNVDHGCGNTSKNPRPIKLTLIDVVDLRLVIGDSTFDYVTLSYVWGRTKSLKLTKSNRALLRQHNGLQSMLPARVVRDAIELTRCIGERYLWVDALCIAQDNQQTSTYYIDRMDHVYFRGLLTIVAYSGKSANDPLPGVHQNTRLPPSSRTVNGRYLIQNFRHTITHTSLPTSDYTSRAWTYQEFLLSNHCLILTDEQAFLSSPSGVFGEESGPQRGVQSNPLWILFARQNYYTTFDNDDFASAVTYRDLVQEYTKRRLSHQIDILRAFAGLSRFLESKMVNGSMVLGLPSKDFALALTWIPVTSDHRVMVCTCPSTGQPLTLPSWCWAGWRGSKTWPWPFRDIEIGAGKPPHDVPTYIPMVTKFYIGTGYGGLWRDINDQAGTPAFTVLRFYCSVVEAGELGFSHNTENSTKTAPGGILVFGIPEIQMLEHDVSLLRIGYWKCYLPYSDSIGNHEVVKVVREEFPLMNGAPHTFEFYTCLVVKWVNAGEARCKRLGVAHVACNVWNAEKVRKMRRTVYLE
ncbi:heterokaryon incompatibility protein-domain-containing protein [Dendryphion nanum]|uniref:Heterokaryon incompatibility protein-domain-containing protein n=1 Tax=Dendryphion nanum TaxID=256645 RepID=A0A9P9D529_9PLEO|nr:heterokaryon incompatibility protein-domain-containing protein [Dendryphion nanum]